MLEVLQFEFMRNALMAGVLASTACGIIGCYVVIKRIVFISGGISHSAYGGIGLGYFLNINPILGAIFFSIAAALGIGVISNKAGQREDSLIGVMWALGMAVGIVFIQLTPGYSGDLLSYLFGSILAVPAEDIIIMLVLDLIIIFTVVMLFKEFLATCFDEEFASLVSYPRAINLVLLLLIALTVVMLIRIVGVILVIAMLTIPAAISAQFTASLKKMMFISVVLGNIFTITGLCFSYFLDIASGAMIIIIAGFSYLVLLGYNNIAKQGYKRQNIDQEKAGGLGEDKIEQ